MNYYKQGDAANADKIKVAFEKKGFIKEDHRDIDENNVLFFTVDDDKNVHYCWIDQPYCNIVKTHPDYQELELPVEPKFKVEDWVVIDNCHNSIYQVDSVREYDYMLKHTHGGLMPFPFSGEKRLSLWTIADAKDGDVLVTTKIRGCPFIYRKTSYKNNLAYYYAGIDGNGDFCEGCLKRTLSHFGLVSDVVPATKEQRDRLFDKMKEAGYTWDADNKELKKIPKHYDIANFKPFDKVLVRDTKYGNWNVNLFSYYIDDIDARIVARFHCINSTWIQCIPFNEDTKHLLGTTDMPSEEYINW